MPDTVTPHLSYEHILRAALATPWAIYEPKLIEIAGVLALRASGGQATPEAIEAAVAMADHPTTPTVQGVAVVPVVGTIMQRGNVLSEMSGGVSTEVLGQRLRELVANEQVQAIVLDIDSPGGSVFGVDELAAEIYSLRGQKPIVAVANSLMASAAYYIASSADQIVATPSALVGSIGVFTMHQDLSVALAQLGIDVTLITAGRFKTEGNTYEPLPTEARDAIQHRIDSYYDQFVAAVARGRSVSRAAVRGGMGEGRVLPATDALEAGLIDRIETLEQTVTRLGNPRQRARVMRAEAPGMTAEPVVEQQAPAIEPEPARAGINMDDVKTALLRRISGGI